MNVYLQQRQAQVASTLAGLYNVRASTTERNRGLGNLGMYQEIEDRTHREHVNNQILRDTRNQILHSLVNHCSLGRTDNGFINREIGRLMAIQEIVEFDENADTPPLVRQPPIGTPLHHPAPQHPNIAGGIHFFNFSVPMGSSIPVDMESVPVTITDEEFARLPTMEFREANQDNEQTTCTICQLLFAPLDEIVEIPSCQHIFHKTCARQLFIRYDRRCPVCRHDVREDVREVTLVSGDIGPATGVVSESANDSDDDSTEMEMEIEVDFSESGSESEMTDVD